MAFRAPSLKPKIEFLTLLTQNEGIQPGMIDWEFFLTICLYLLITMLNHLLPFPSHGTYVYILKLTKDIV